MLVSRLKIVVIVCKRFGMFHIVSSKIVQDTSNQLHWMCRSSLCLPTRGVWDSVESNRPSSKSALPLSGVPLFKRAKKSPLANPLKFMWVSLKIGYQKKWWSIIRFSLLHGHKLKVTFPMFRYDLILNILRYILSSYINYIILTRSILIPIISY